ncbi:HAUS augmin-like complex subunit 2 isoform X2 [Paramormyrops kingsleyae]|nr:HAUS augmin-like complex subunit 2 isoform X2 [Paramormyrops kingsleyae]XP_023684289.1 HAUS augmin-like complex subunit 2 isoform X2 [Paramormyrops kingsleyae]XP_023684292.1 HAUS augmin-like complex subunit 2 isoform X2 [Paramormyrops kingsleyae]XP_023684293.1 HAUS augmin-like complex subunit 2 isoform X2 [Paramormyrops kingsleyae]
MNPWDPVSYSVTPAAQVLARCVASGVLSQGDLDAVPREKNVFSHHLLEAERVVNMNSETDNKRLEIELLKLEKETADVTHSFFLSQKFTALQQFTSHLQEVLREQTSLRQRLMKPLCQQNLPVEASLHRYVVELIDMAVDLIKNLESKMRTTRTIPSINHMMTRMDNVLAQLLTQVADIQELSRQILQWKDHQRSEMTKNDSHS